MSDYSSSTATPVYLAGHVSTGNSTTTALSGDATYTGDETITSHPDILVTLKTDVAGTLYIDLGVVSGTYDTTLTFDVAAGSGEFHTAVKGTLYCRVRYTNGSSAQSYFRMQTEFGHFRQGNLSVNRSMQADADATVVRPTNASHETALGRRQGATLWHKFGYNTDVDTGAAEVLAAFGGTFTPRTTATTLSIVSSSTADDSGSTGATGIVVYGVDANWDSQVEVVTMDGQTPVVTTSTWIGINRIAIFAAGDGMTNAGTITITAVTGGATMATMPAGEGTSQQVIFHVPADGQALIDHINLSVVRAAQGNTQPVVTAILKVFSAVSNANYRVATFYLDGALNNNFSFDPQHPLQVGEKSAIWIDASTTLDNTSVAGRMVLTVYQDPAA